MIWEESTRTKHASISIAGPAAKKQRLFEAAVQKPNARTPKDRKRAAAAELPEGQLFVQCEICSKWRLLPDDTQVTRQPGIACAQRPLQHPMKQERYC